MKKIGLGLFLCGLLFTCTQEESYLAGKLTVINGFEKEYTLAGEEVKLEGVYTGYMSVYDSLMLFCSSQFGDYMLYTYNLNNGKQLKSLFKAGRGPNEFSDLTHTGQHEKESNDIKLWIYDEHKSYMLVNLSRSLPLHSDSLVIDSIIPIEARKVVKDYLGYVFVLDNSKFIVRKPCEKLYYDDPRYIPGNYTLYLRSLDHPQQTYTLFHKPVINPSNKFPNIYFASNDKIKPDRSKIAMAMHMVAQINILDIETGELKGFRLKGTPGFDYLKGDPKNFRNYYLKLTVDDRFIYAIYEDLPFYGHREEQRTNTIVHVFDWDGHPACKIVIKQVLGQIALDPATGYLYGKTYMEEIFRYDLKTVPLMNEGK